mgnify:CR=1 FL=1
MLRSSGSNRCSVAQPRRVMARMLSGLLRRSSPCNSSNRKIANDAAAHVQEDVFEIQTNAHVRVHVRSTRKRIHHACFSSEAAELQPDVEMARRSGRW